MITVLGAGSWGFALAHHMALQGKAIQLWNRPSARFDRLQTSMQQEQPTLNIHFLSGTLQAALAQTSVVMVALNASGFRELLPQLQQYPTLPLCSLTKGFADDKGTLFHEVFQATAQPYGMLCGPSFATEVRHGSPTVLVLATQSQTLQHLLMPYLAHHALRIQACDDLIGVQWCAILKNIVALGLGWAETAGSGRNAKAWLFSQALAEMRSLLCAAGGDPTTVDTPAGVGDVYLTATEGSRNYRFGQLMGQGHCVSAALDLMNDTVEGYYALPIVQHWAKKYQLRAPLLNLWYQVFYQALSPADFWANFMREF